MALETVKLSELVTHPIRVGHIQPPGRGLVEDIRLNGILNPPLVDRDLQVIDGERTIEAARQVFGPDADISVARFLDWEVGIRRLRRRHGRFTEHNQPVNSRRAWEVHTLLRPYIAVRTYEARQNRVRGQKGTSSRSQIIEAIGVTEHFFTYSCALYNRILEPGDTPRDLLTSIIADVDAGRCTATVGMRRLATGITQRQSQINPDIQAGTLIELTNTLRSVEQVAAGILTLHESIPDATLRSTLAATVAAKTKLFQLTRALRNRIEDTTHESKQV